MNHEENNRNRYSDLSVDGAIVLRNRDKSLAGCEMSSAPTSPQIETPNPAAQLAILVNDDGTPFTGIRVDGTEIHPLYGPIPTIEVGIRAKG